MKDIILLMHPMFGVLGAISAVWVFIETLNAREENQKRIRCASVLVALFMVIVWIVGGYWYVVYYGADRVMILKGPWAFAHNIFMETKEHLFFVTLVLALYLPLVTFKNNLVTNRSARMVVLTVSALIVLSAMVIEGAGGVISMGVKLGLVHSLSATSAVPVVPLIK